MYIEQIKKTTDLVGQEISLYKEYPIVNLLWKDKVIVKQQKQIIQSSDYLIKNEHLLQVISLKKAEINNCILFNNKLYKVVNIDDTREGIFIINAAYVTVNKTYSISLTETQNTLKVGDTYIINVECRENNNIVSNPIVSYEVNNPIMATINGNTVTALKEGICIITCKFETVKVELTINVQAKEEIIKKEFIIQGSEQIKVNTTQTYNIIHKDGTSTTGRSFIFSVDDPEIAQIISQTDNTCTIKGLLLNELFILTVKDKLDLTQVVNKNVFIVK